METSNQSILLLKSIGPKPVRLAIGNFDGVHVGHRRLISDLVARAEAEGHSSVVMSFCPHPSQFFGKNSNFKKIDTESIQRRILAELGVTGLLELPFDAILAELSADQFLDLLIKNLPLKEIIVGNDFRFGKHRVGHVDLLSQHGRAHGYSVNVMEKMCVDGVVASSSSVRSLLALDGDVEGAARILGRLFCLQGVVVKGDQVGRTIGFPTANIGDIHQLIPKNGVYSGRMKVAQEPSQSSQSEAWLPCVINIGVRPTIKLKANEDRRVEAHVYDANGTNLDIYGRGVEVEFMRYLRDEKRFHGIESLKNQIAADIAHARS